jgi:hypothetical protein
MDWQGVNFTSTARMGDDAGLGVSFAFTLVDFGRIARPCSRGFRTNIPSMWRFATVEMAA